MIKVIKKQIQVLWRDWLWEFAGVLILWLIGFGILHLIMLEDAESWLALGTLMAIMIEAMIALLTGVISMGICFNLQVSMGCTRKRFYVSYYLANVVKDLLIVLLLLLLCAAETQLCKVIYPGTASKLDLFPWLLKLGAPAALAVPAVGILCGALLLRFGRKGYWVLWFLWMFAFLGVPRIMDAPDGTFFGELAGGISRVAQAVPEGGWILAGAAGILLCIAVSWGMLRRQQVTA